MCIVPAAAARVSCTVAPALPRCHAWQPAPALPNSTFAESTHLDTPHRAAEITQRSYVLEDYKQILGILARRLHSEPRHWRHSYKSLLLLDYMVRNGPERMVSELKSNGRVFSKLQQFQYIDSKNKDQGINVRNRWAAPRVCLPAAQRSLLKLFQHCHCFG